MSEYGIRIRNIQAGSLYDYNLGVRDNFDQKRAMLTNSLFSDFLVKNGLKVSKMDSTRDIICLEFKYGSRSYEDEVKHLNKMLKETEERKDLSDDEKEVRKKRLNDLMTAANENKDKFNKKTKQEIRTQFYTEGVPITYNTYNSKKELIKTETIHYRMLFRTPGKAKKGSCMFIRDELYDKARDFLYMGLKLPEHNSPIVEMGAYSSLITSSIVGTVRIDPMNIFIMKDIDSFFNTKVISVETDENKQCRAIPIDNYRLKNTLFDGQALIDSSIFPDWGEGYILLRHHLCKMAAFSANIQEFFRDYYGDDYETAEIVDMFGISHKVKDIQLITTDNAVKWIKFDTTYEYWCEKVRENDCQFGIVKTAHQSKLGDVQRMSYQMINALDSSIMDSVTAKSVEYVNKLKTDNETFFKYLEDNVSFSNDYDVLVALCRHNPAFVRSDYFRERKKKIILGYVTNLKNGHVIQNADNLVIVGSPYAMLLATVGEPVENDNTFAPEEFAIQCYTERFDDGEYLAGFRSPFNSRNNLVRYHNVYDGRYKKYFNFGPQIIAVNMIGTDMQDRN